MTCVQISGWLVITNHCSRGKTHNWDLHIICHTSVYLQESILFRNAILAQSNVCFRCWCTVDDQLMHSLTAKSNKWWAHNQPTSYRRYFLCLCLSVDRGGQERKKWPGGDWREAGRKVYCPQIPSREMHKLGGGSVCCYVGHYCSPVCPAGCSTSRSTNYEQ